MSDLVTRLRDRAYSFKAPDPLLEEAAAEIERLHRVLATQECDILKRSLLELIDKWDARAFTDLDPEPAGKAAEPESSVPLGSGAALANTQEPVAWAAELPERIATFDRKMLFGADPTNVRLAGDALNCYVDVFPLYRHPQPTLIDEERAAIMWFAHYGLPEGRAATLRKLLERLK